MPIVARAAVDRNVDEVPLGTGNFVHRRNLGATRGRGARRRLRSDARRGGRCLRDGARNGPRLGQHQGEIPAVIGAGSSLPIPGNEIDRHRRNWIARTTALSDLYRTYARCADVLDALQRRADPVELIHDPVRRRSDLARTQRNARPRQQLRSAGGGATGNPRNATEPRCPGRYVGIE